MDVGGLDVKEQFMPTVLCHRGATSIGTMIFII